MTKKYTVPIEIFEMQDGGCHLFVEALFSDKEKGWVIIDTGANRSVFDKILLQEHITLKAIIKDDISAGINATIEESQEAIIHQIQLNKFQIADFKTVVISLEYLNKMYGKITNKKVWGLIGGDFLMKYNGIIDYSSEQLMLEK